MGASLMASAAQVATASLKRILVEADESPLEASEYQDFIDSMNNYMLALDAEGIKLGYTLVSDLGDEVTVPVGALRGIIANMAIEVSPDYGGQVSAGLINAARDGMRAMLRLGMGILPTAYPSTLPRGSGNEGCFDTDYHFYPELEATILSETTGSVNVESGTKAAI